MSCLPTEVPSGSTETRITTSSVQGQDVPHKLNSTWSSGSTSVQQDSIQSNKSSLSSTQLKQLNSTWHSSTTVREPNGIERIRQDFGLSTRTNPPALHSLSPVVVPPPTDLDEDPTFKVFCFPHAGGGGHSFQHWSELALEEGMELIRIDYPGTKQNSCKKLRAISIQELANKLLPRIVEELDRPFIFFGHSMGGVVAYEVSRIMYERGLPQPGGIIISSVPPPNYPQQHTTLSNLNDEDFVAQAYGNGWFPKEALHNKELTSIMLPKLRHDIAMYEQYIQSFQAYNFSRNTDEGTGTTDVANQSKSHTTWYLDHHVDTTTTMYKMSSPVYVVGGGKDVSVHPNSLNAWSKLVTKDVSFTKTIVASEGHFHLHTKQTFGLLHLACAQALQGRKMSIAVGKHVLYEEEQYCIHELFNKQALLTPKKTAIVDQRRGAVTFEVMLKEVNLLASWLRYHRVGVGLNGVVGILSQTTADYLIAIFAAMQAGGCVLPFYTNYTSELISELVDNAKVKFMIIDETTDENLVPDGCEYFVLTTEWYQHLHEQASALNDFVLYDTSPPVPTTSCCMMAMTSGSTGKPKAIVCSHLATTVSLGMRFKEFPYDDDSVVATNIFFIWEAIRAPLKGVTIHIIPDDVLLDPKRFVSFLHRSKATRMVVTAQLTKNILDYPNLDLKKHLKYMKYWWLCGEVCPRSLAKNWNKRVLPSSELWNFLSTWESLDVSYARLSPLPCRTDYSASRFSTVGSAIPNVIVYVMNPKTNQPVPQGVLGEVFIGGRGMSDGYYNDQVRTKNAFVPNPFVNFKYNIKDIFVAPWDGEGNYVSGVQEQKNTPTSIDGVHDASDVSHELTLGHKVPLLYKTGDRGRLLSNGELELAGRDGNIIKIRGFKVGLLMVENALLSFDEIVKACIVVPVLNPETKQPRSLCCYIVGPTSTKPTTEQCQFLLKEMREKVPSYAVPEYCVPLVTFPTRPGNGKLDKKKLPPPMDGIRAGSSSSTGSASSGNGNRSESGHGSIGTAMDHLEKAIVSVWVEVLGKETAFNNTDNFFEVGGHSLKAATLIGMLTAKFGLNLSVVDLYSCPTVQSLADLLREKLGTKGAKRLSTRSISAHHNVHEDHGTSTTPQVRQRVDVAVIGMAGKFPGANDVNEFWNNLTNGVDSLRTFTDEELIRCGVSTEIRDHPNFVQKGQVIDRPDQFDAYFWGIGKEEAKMMDPQQRLFLQTCWHAMEDAGYPPRSGSNFETGVFASCGIDGYMIHHLEGAKVLREGTLDPASIFKTEVGNEKDYIATRVSYHLNLGGPSYTINSACSSGLVSVSEAVNSIQSGRCDVALAGASSLTFPNTGYLYSEGLVSSPDGHVRPFDEKAGGTLFGDGIGAVVLKRLDDAMKDGDRIMAVVRGAAVTNDGHDKAGYSAPASAAQQRAIVRAQRRAGVTSDQISYVECHATATHVGDAIEMRGLKEAFEENMQKSSTSSTSSASSPVECALGSVKGNIGHANCAAGITGFMKTVLCLYHKTLVPTVHYSKLNSKINFSGTGFSVNDATKKWVVNSQGRGSGESEGALRMAGVSSFGVGGTNAHVVLQEAPTSFAGVREETEQNAPQYASLSSKKDDDDDDDDDNDEIVIVSARTISSLKSNLRSLANHVEMTQTNKENNDKIKLADVALTLSTGREHLQYRYSTVVRNASELIIALRGDVGNKSKFKEMAKVADTGSSIGGDVIFVFPGQGSQYIQMSAGLYQNEPTYRKHLDACADVVDRIHKQRGVCAGGIDGSGGCNVLGVMFGSDASTFLRPSFVQPCIFMVEYCMARTLMEYGIVPLAMGGHSIGEYVAATLAGVFQLEDALELIVLRGIATENGAVEGSMLSISNIDQETLANILLEHSGVTVATHNAPGMYVLSGTPEHIQTLHASLTSKPPSEKTRIVLLRVNRAFHSPLMDGAAQKLEEFLENVEIKSPSIPVTSNVTGNWMGGECREPKYWGDHMRGTVRFVDNAKCLSQWSTAAIVEVGPGSTLCKLLTKCWAADVLDVNGVKGVKDVTFRPPPLVPSMRHPKATDVSDSNVFHATLGKLWCCGISANWKTYHKKRRTLKDRIPQKISLPGYAFAETSFWCDSSRSIYVVEDANDKNAEALGLKKKATMLSEDDCLVVLTGGTAREVKKIIVCFTYAGGSSRTFASWKAELIRRGLEQTVQILAVELQGRGKRSEEDIAATVQEDDVEHRNIAEGLTRHLKKVQRGTSVVLCGLSMGALYAIRVSSMVHAPDGVFLSEIVLAGRCPPFEQIEHGQNGKNAGDLKPFTEEDIAQYNLTSTEITESAAWREHFLPLLLSDLAVDQRLSLSSELRVPSKFDVRIVCGMKDPSFPQEKAVDWERVGGNTFKVTLVRGGHEFLNEKVSEMLSACLGDDVMQLKAPSTASSMVGFDGKEKATPSPVFRVEWLPSGVYEYNAKEDMSANKNDTTHLALGQELIEIEIVTSTVVLRILSCPDLILKDPSECTKYFINQAWSFTQFVQSIVQKMEDDQTGVSRVHIILVADDSTNAVFGVSRSVTLEFPELTFQRLLMAREVRDEDEEDEDDYDDNDGNDEVSIGFVTSFARHFSNETDVEYNVTTNVVRLRRAASSLSALTTSNLDKKVLHGDGLYVLTGGTGGIGSVLVQWLINVQRVAPGDIVLLTRRDGPHSHPLGVRMITLDVSDPTQWTDVQIESLRCITDRKLMHGDTETKTTRKKKMRQRRVLGLFHLAGVLDDGTLTNMTRQRVQKVMAPKVNGILHLLAFSKQWKWKTKFAVVFSSTTSLLGYPGQTNYAAANSVLDGLGTSSIANDAITGGVPIVCCNWGPWGEVGMAQIGSKPYNSALKGGELPMMSFDALTSLEHVLRDFSSGSGSGESRQVGICRVEWSRSEWSQSPMICNLDDEKVPLPPTAQVKGGKSTKEDEEDDEEGLPENDIEIFFANRVSSWIPSETLTALGVDSLDEVQLRNDFQREFNVKVPLSMFVVPNQTLRTLCLKLKEVV